MTNGTLPNSDDTRNRKLHRCLRERHRVAASFSYLPRFTVSHRISEHGTRTEREPRVCVLTAECSCRRRRFRASTSVEHTALLGPKIPRPMMAERSRSGRKRHRHEPVTRAVAPDQGCQIERKWLKKIFLEKKSTISKRELFCTTRDKGFFYLSHDFTEKKRVK